MTYRRDAILAGLSSAIVCALLQYPTFRDFEETGLAFDEVAYGTSVGSYGVRLTGLVFIAFWSPIAIRYARPPVGAATIAIILSATGWLFVFASTLGAGLAFDVIAARTSLWSSRPVAIAAFSASTLPFGALGGAIIGVAACVMGSGIDRRTVVRTTLAATLITLCAQIGSHFTDLNWLVWWLVYLATWQPMIAALAEPPPRKNQVGLDS